MAAKLAALLALLCIALTACSARQMSTESQGSADALQLPLPSYDELAEIVAAEVAKMGRGRQLLSKPDMGRLAAVTAKRIACEAGCRMAAAADGLPRMRGTAARRSWAAPAVRRARPLTASSSARHASYSLTHPPTQPW